MNRKVVTANLKNQHGLSQDHIHAITQYFEPVASVDEKIAACLIRFVVDGSDEDVVSNISGKVEIATALGYGNQVDWKNRSYLMTLKSVVLNGERTAAPEVWLRFAQILEHAYRSYGTQLRVPTAWPVALGVLLAEIGIAHNSYKNWKRWSLLELEKIFLHCDLQADALMMLLLDPKAEQNVRIPALYYYGGGLSNPGVAYCEIDEYFYKHFATLQKMLAAGSAEQQVHILNLLKQNDCKKSIDALTNLLVQCSTSSSKTVREAATNLMMDNDLKGLPVFRPELEKLLAQGNTGQRNEAVCLLWKLYGAATTDILKKQLETESADRVRQTINKLIAAAEIPAEQEKYDLAPLDLELGIVPLDESIKQKLSKIFQDSYQVSLKNYEKQKQDYESPNKPQWVSKPAVPPELSEKEMQDTFDFIEGKAAALDQQIINTIATQFQHSGDWIDPEKVKLIHIVRLSYAVRVLMIQPEGNPLYKFSWYNRAMLEAYRAQCAKPFGLRELDAAVATLPRSKPGYVANAYLTHNTKWSSFLDWEPEAVWTIYAEYPELLRQPFAPRKTPGYYDYVSETMRGNAFRVLAMFPKVPAEFLPLLWDLALGETKSERYAAQEALNSVAGKTATIIVALSDGKQSIRSAAAEWLGRLGDQEAVAPLKKAFLKEKNEQAKGTIMLALDALDANVDEFLNRDDLLKEAKAGLAKKMPRGMEWFSLETLPKLHWQDTGTQVDPEIVKWWLAQSIQQKTPVCTPILKRYLRMCRPAEAAALARWVLSTWIAYDTASPSAEVAAKRADEEAEKQWNMYSMHQYYADMYGSKEGLANVLFNSYSNEFLNSAIEQKGALALVSAAGDAECVKMMEKYIRKYFGHKLAHCKAFVEVLAWIDLPLSLQVLLSIANRFRTKAIRQLAEELVQATADRQGWTIDELADRTIPDAGFERARDENGEATGKESLLELDYGPRQFEVRLNDELEAVICVKGESKPLKAPPAPGKSDDEEKAKAARKAFSDAKKLVKEVVKRQSERIYEALCTQRSWKFEDWKRYLAEHPIVGRLCTHVVWAAFEAQTDPAKERVFISCFRPMEDGSLTNESDEEVQLPADAQVLVAHPCNSSPQTGELWLKHFKDYDLIPLFAQFGRSTYTLPEEKKKETQICDFQGHMISTFKLRSRATKLGYTRGQAEDGGCFYTYHKAFPSLSIQAIITFTGSYLPEQDIPAALNALEFTAISQNDSYSNSMPLSKVPAVLLSECYNDMKQIAADGSGFDPKWQEKSYF